MKIGYARISKSDGSQSLDPQIDVLIKEGVEPANIFTDQISGAKSERPGLSMLLRALRREDVLLVWSLDRLGRNLRHLINIVQELEDKGVSLKILHGAGAGIDTGTATGRLMFQIFGVLAEFERNMIRERTLAGIQAARARGRNGGRKFKLTKSKVRLLQASMGKNETVVSDLCKELGVTRSTVYKYVGPDGQLRERALKVLEK